MDPRPDRARRTRMRRLALTVTALALPLALAACGSDGDDVATDPAPSTTSASPASAGPSAATAAPTVGTYPAFEPEDYGYTLAISCFCIGAGVPVRVTVAAGEVTAAVYAADDTGRGGVGKGDPADQLFHLTIDDVIDEANDTGAARVDVDWPPGQDFPNSVYVDGDELVADDEAGYTISDVVVSP